jgi:uncharacterized Zn-binding protein involved in type VI secretion
VPGAHRDTDVRFCLAKTKVTGQSKVLVNGLLWAVEGDKNDHCNQGALSAVYGSKCIEISGKKIICAMGDAAAGDHEDCIYEHPAGSTNPLGHSYDVLVYGGAAGGGK